MLNQIFPRAEKVQEKLSNQGFLIVCFAVNFARRITSAKAVEASQAYIEWHEWIITNPALRRDLNF